MSIEKVPAKVNSAIVSALLDLLDRDAGDAGQGVGADVEQVDVEEQLLAGLDRQGDPSGKTKSSVPTPEAKRSVSWFWKN